MNLWRIFYHCPEHDIEDDFLCPYLFTFFFFPWKKLFTISHRYSLYFSINFRKKLWWRPKNNGPFISVILSKDYTLLCCCYGWQGWKLWACILKKKIAPNSLRSALPDKLFLVPLKFTGALFCKLKPQSWPENSETTMIEVRWQFPFSKRHKHSHCAFLNVCVVLDHCVYTCASRFRTYKTPLPKF